MLVAKGADPEKERIAMRANRAEVARLSSERENATATKVLFAIGIIVVVVLVAISGVFSEPWQNPLGEKFRHPFAYALSVLLFAALYALFKRS